jgi:MoaA/NifB/PqqE/SkfB family radical SAM enzyme
VPKLTLIFSVYAADASIHDTITGRPGSLEILQESLSRSLRVGIAVEFHFVPMRPNWRELVEVVSLAERFWVRRVSILRFVPQGRGSRSR